jgi:hypothetical protein
MSDQVRIVRGFHGQAAQDWFVASVNGKRGGTFVDLGAGDPDRNSNTVLLERGFGWRGVLSDIATRDLLVRDRASENAVFGDAFDTEVDAAIVSLAGERGEIDYLSLDLEPPDLTLRRLCSLPLDRVRFGIVTCEHDLYRDATGSIKAAMAGVLVHHGYRLVADNVLMIAGSGEESRLVPVEDWWVHQSIHDSRGASAIAGELLLEITRRQRDSIMKMREAR